MQSKFQSTWVISVILWFISCVVAVSIIQPIPSQAAVNRQETGTPAPAQLIWRGPAEIGSADQSQCTSWSINSDNRAALRSCTGVIKTQALEADVLQVWTTFRERFAPFRYTTSAETLEFQGVGETDASAAWQRALNAWARGQYAEQKSGKDSAARLIVVSWYSGPEPAYNNLCTHLSVLAYGYAYAATLPCGGNQVVDVVGSWLTDVELEALDGWLYQRAPLYQATNYINGAGVQPMTPEDVTAAGLWAGALWRRVRETTPVTPAPSTIAPIAPPTATWTSTPLPTRAATPTPFPTPTASATPKPVPTAIVIVTLTPFPTVTPTSVASPTPLPTPTATATATPRFPTATATAVSSPTPTRTATIRATATALGALQPTLSLTITVTTVATASVQTPSTTSVPTPTATTPTTSTMQAVQAVTNVNIRSGPGTTYAVVGRVVARQIVPIIGAAPENGWWRVICPTDATGNCFVSADPRFTKPASLAADTPAPVAASPIVPAAVFTLSGWLTYTNPAAQFAIAYPPTWTITSTTNGPGFAGGVVGFQSSPQGLEPTYRIEIGQHQQSIASTADLAEWTLAYTQETTEFSAEETKISTLEARTVDGLEAIFIRWSTPLGDSQYTNIRRGQTVWFVWSNIGNLTDEETKTIYEQMVNSLNFE